MEVKKLSNYKLGILGGMGPLATVKLYERIVNKTKASCDQEHIEMVILNKCSIPDRTLALTANGTDPLPYLNEGIEELISLGCKYFCIPCNTAHAYKDRFKNLEKIEFIDMIEEAKKYLSSLKKDICVFCTNGTRKVNVYDAPFLVYPDISMQDDIMQIVTDTKAGVDCFDRLYGFIKKVNKPVLLACTEFSIYYDRLLKCSDIEVYDAMDILVNKIIEKCQSK